MISRVKICIAAIIFTLFYLAGCENETSITSQSDTIVNPTSTNSVTTSTTEAIPIIAALSSDVLDSLGTGVQADIVFTKAGLSSNWPQAGKHRFSIDQRLMIFRL